MRSIVIHECKDDIRQLIQDTYDGDVPSGPLYIREFQKGVTAYISELSKEECAEYEEQARLWNLQGPDPEEQRKYVFQNHSTLTSYSLSVHPKVGCKEGAIIHQVLCRCNEEATRY